MRRGKKVLLGVIVLFVVLLSFSAITKENVPTTTLTSVVYCDHMGYQIDLVRCVCVFDDGKECFLNDFLSGDCGSNYVKKIVRKEGDVVFPDFESCEEGLNYYLNENLNQLICGYDEEVVPNLLKL